MSSKDRDSFLASRRNLKMARSPATYIRGTTKHFYEWLERRSIFIPDGPPIWICGDCHLGNLGALADCEGKVAVQIRDFDQTVIGNPAHDLIRLGLSLASAARDSDLPGVTTARMLDALIAGYELASVESQASTPHLRKPKDIRKLLKRATHRRWKNLAMEDFQTKHPLLPRNKRLWPLHRAERAAVLALCSDREMEMSVLGSEKLTSGDLKILDAAFWIKGCSSLGRLRCAVLVQDCKHGPVSLLDIKEAAAACAPSASQAEMPRGYAERVVAGATALSPNLGERMVASRVMDKAVFVREIAPQDMKIEIDRLDGNELQALARYLGGVVGHAHGRQMDRREWQSWTSELGHSRRKKPGAPSWLWSSVVELLSIHDKAYLEHCRKFALTHH
ncbi:MULTISPECIES: DUF2252 family protein [unclassified Rhizobium]|uniref:DUF2252 family protein n=1 Tax=unclassified Rhizobium TaxID=2613769 RepID=UPI000EAA1EB9|nr:MULTISPECIES: DUF2252 family protein [unclassified Rhizobium]AYG70065.1 DUF2252 domain-containing protein [Rhizobium sp. CCGE531]AYG76440.1 DUF2252 domain-containing protein [Rhizobium sp. CCGE532]